MERGTASVLAVCALRSPCPVKELEQGVRMHPDGSKQTKREESVKTGNRSREWCGPQTRRSSAKAVEARSRDFRPKGYLDGWAEGACLRNSETVLFELIA